ncbi:hypothetical protein Bca52824_040627 [Brassica carinata]|uniref:Uncharacterized protein n=1 Tax=Brassica carinata TaxID=52824 RepID=A0A8X7RV69_BRACI|nr:hypothetical protein Bca52824_040627 [Brassica carinata]
MPLLSYGCYFRKIAWHRWIVMWQIKQLNEPIEDKITEWNTGGLLTRIEGFTGFIPKQEMVKKEKLYLREGPPGWNLLPKSYHMERKSNSGMVVGLQKMFNGNTYLLVVSFLRLIFLTL